MENQKSDLTNPLSAQAARAEDLSVLLPAIEEFQNGIDLQPLENISQADIIPFEDNFVLDESEIDKKKNNKEHKQKIKKRIVRTLIIVLVAGALLFTAYNVYLRINDFGHPAVAVYVKGSNAEILLDNDKTVTIENAVEAKMSNDGRFVAYSQINSQDSDKCDIKIVNLSDRSSVNKGGKSIFEGAENDWRISKDGMYIYYSSLSNGVKNCYLYSTENGKSETVAEAVDSFYVPLQGATVYFTKKQAEVTQVYKKQAGEKPEKIADANGIKGFSDENTYEIIYTVPSSDSLIDIYRITQDTEPAKIASDVSEVTLDSYRAGGNLYYFVKSESKFNWNDYVVDDYAESDASMKKPNENDYMKTVGWLFKRKKLDSAAYSAAMQKYNQKLTRDSIREELDKLDLGLEFSSEYKIKVFNGEGSKELAGGVKMENLVSCSDTGFAKIIVQKSGIDSAKKITMDELFRMANQTTAAEAVNDAFKGLKEQGYEVVEGYKYVFYNGTNVYEYNYNYSSMINTDDSEILFGSHNSVFTVTKNKKNEMYYDIYFSHVDKDEFTKAEKVLEKVSSFEIQGGNLYATVACENVNNDLYVCTDSGKVNKISDNLIKYVVNDDDSVYVMTSDKGESVVTSVDLYLYSDGRLDEIEKDVWYKNIVFGNSMVAYIKNYRTSEKDNGNDGGNMIIYEKGRKNQIEGTVSKILDIR